MTTYRVCDEDVYRRVHELIEQHHPQLRDAGVTVALLFAFATKDAETGEPTGPALRQGGYACAGLTKITNLKDRTKGMADAEVLLDGDQWEGWTADQQSALLDHELTHLEVKTEGRGENPRIVKDAVERPMLRLKKHDHQFGWFDSIAERWGAASFEVQQATQLYEEAKQLYFAFAAPAVDVDQVVQEARGGARAKTTPRPRAA